MFLPVQELHSHREALWEVPLLGEKKEKHQEAVFGLFPKRRPEKKMPRSILMQPERHTRTTYVNMYAYFLVRE